MALHEDQDDYLQGPHPYYGPCDQIGPHGYCAECLKIGAVTYVSPFPLPTPGQDEILKQLIEECSEVIHRTSKLQRFGRNEIAGGQNLTNVQRLSQEIGNLLQMIDELQNIDMIDMRFVDLGREEKKRKLPIYMQHLK